MADPTIQTFCCHNGNGSEIARTILSEFNTDNYNVVCMVSSAFGILGAIYQILPRQQNINNHRWLSFTALRGRKIIIWLAVADLLAALGVFVRSAIWMNYKNIMPGIDDNSSVLFCALSSAWTQYFYTATWIWTLCYAIDIRLILSEQETKPFYYHFSAWFIPAILTTFGLSLLYVPNADCHTARSLTVAFIRILPNYIATYIPITVVMILNPYLYRESTRDLERVVAYRFGQVTARERDIVDAVRVKFAVINVVFYLCWLPNLLNGLLLWALWFHLPANIIITTWYTMALMNPLQALFNCLVYRRWTWGSEKLLLPWAQSSTSSIKKENQETTKEEKLPLLRHSSKSSINGANF